MAESTTLRRPLVALRIVLGFASLVAVSTLSAAEPAARDEVKKKPLELAVFEKLLARHPDMTYDQLHTALIKDRKFLDRLSFDPKRAAYFDRVAGKLQLTRQELDLFQKAGFVSVDMQRRHSFASAYYQIYSQDLPVLVTTDSIMHALHRSYDDILMELEQTLFAWTVGQILDDCHRALANSSADNTDKTLAASYRDVDLYLTVARNLLAGAGAPREGQDDIWSGGLLIPSKLSNDEEALARLKDVQSLKLQTPDSGPPTSIYGGQRYFDWSQFKPRGHYTKAPALKRYFRCLMWLGRADCGWNVLPTDGTPGVKSDSDRELRDAVLLVELLAATDNVKTLKGLDDIIAFLVGRSDNLTVFTLRGLMEEQRTATLAAVSDGKALARLKDAVKNGKHAQQMIRSQVVISDPKDPYYKVPPPALFQLFGQRYIIDSFVLSQVVFDSIVFEKRKQKRMMPMGLDVMAALGNNEAIPLLADELRQWNYSANLMASREYVDLHEAAFWKANLYNLWLDSLRTLHADMKEEKHFPEALRTRAWQLKQLQTQLGSWAELRHDTILYAKQSYTAFPFCEYPAGYVEPYPEFYARVKYFAEEASRRFLAADYTIKNANRAAQLKGIKQQQVTFFKKMAETMDRLEKLARKELKAEPFTDQEKAFIKRTIDQRGEGSGPPRYDGWYCDLFYRPADAIKWDPVIADVHTDPESGKCLEVGVGDVTLGVIAIDNEKDRAVYVGPLYSYYEFRHPVEDRLTDQQWQEMISAGKVPPRPKWVDAFQAPAHKR
jgi:hypothetical protein